jgi:hypothetical protein
MGLGPYWCDWGKEQIVVSREHGDELSGFVKYADILKAGDLVGCQGGQLHGVSLSYPTQWGLSEALRLIRCAEVLVCQHVPAAFVRLAVRSALCSFTVLQFYSLHCAANLLHAISFSSRVSWPQRETTIVQQAGWGLGVGLNVVLRKVTPAVYRSSVLTANSQYCSIQ